jgi:predicted MFS family arabinose efflux permease
MAVQEGLEQRPSGSSRTERESLWRNRDFVVLLTGETVSQLGSQITLFALPIAAVLLLHASGGQIGLLKTLFTLPYFFLPLVIGVHMDRRPRRPAMLMANAMRSVLVFTIPVLAWTHLLSITDLFVVALLGGAFSVLFDVAYSSYVPTLVGRPRLSEANGLLQTGYSAAFLSGPGLAGLLVSAIGAPAALVADAASYLVSFTTISSIKTKEPALVRDGQRRRAWAEARQGISALFRIAPIRQIALHAAIYNGFFQFIEVAFLVYALRVRHIGSGFFGVAVTIGGIGGLFGALRSARVVRRMGLGPAMLLAVSLETVVYFMLPVWRGDRFTVTILFGLTFMVGGIGAGIANSVVATIRQGFTPDRLMARVGAGYRTMNFGAIPIGAALGGVMVTTVGVRATLWLTPIGLIASALPLVLTSFKRLRDLPTAQQLDESYASLIV